MIYLRTIDHYSIEISVGPDGDYAAQVAYCGDHSAWLPRIGWTDLISHVDKLRAMSDTEFLVWIHTSIAERCT